MFKHVAKRTEKRDTVRKPKDRRNGRFSGVACPCLNPSPSFLLRTLSARFCERIEGCGKKVEETVTMSWFAPLARKTIAWKYKQQTPEMVIEILKHIAKQTEKPLPRDWISLGKEN